MDRLFAVAFVLLFVGGFGAAGLFILWGYFRARRQAQASLGWPAVEGEILEAYVRREEETDADGEWRVTYFPEVRYAYRVLGQEYVGNQITFGGTLGGSSPARARAVVARYPEGERVTVYYNPDNPQEAVLERKVAAPWLLLVVGGAFLTAAVCIGGLLLSAAFGGK